MTKSDVLVVPHGSRPTWLSPDAHYALIIPTVEIIPFLIAYCRCTGWRTPYRIGQPILRRPAHGLTVGEQLGKDGPNQAPHRESAHSVVVSFQEQALSEILLNVTPPSGDAYDATLDSIRSGGWSLLCGSAISIFEPTSLPSGMDVGSKLASAFCGEAGVDEPFRRLILEVPYEVILSLYPRKDELDHILASYFRNGGTDHEATGRLAPNAIHEVIASLLLDGTFRNVLTTNYDPCIEAGSGGRIEASIDGGGLTGDRKGLLYKIHGCAVHGSMVYTIEQEPRMPVDKVEILRRCAGDKLLVIGYSGLDFEVCPELYSMNLSRLVWIAFPADASSPDLSPNARKVLGNHPNHLVICADMRTVFRDLLGLSKDWSPDRGQPRTPDLPGLLWNRLSSSERRLWAARVFLNMSAPSAAFKMAPLQTTDRVAMIPFCSFLRRQIPGTAVR